MILDWHMLSRPATRSHQIQPLRLSSGENALKRLLRSTPTDPMTRLYMGGLRGIDGDLGGATEEHDRALALAW